MTRLLVEVDDVVSAAVLLSDRVAEPVREALGGLTSTLTTCASMAGADPGGTEWAAAYDRAARSVLDATRQLVNGAYRTSTLLAGSASNYARAEAASTTGGPGTTPELLQRLPAEQYLGPVAVPAAAGGSGDTPMGWWLVSHTVGYLWPDGHQDRLRNAGRAWFDSADALDDAAGVVGYAGACFVLDGLPEAEDITTVCTGLHDRLLCLSDAHRALSVTCTDLAARLDHCHAEAEDALTELLAESAAIQAVGGLIAAASFGAAEAPTQAAQAARIAAVAARIGRVMDRFLVSARHLAQGFTAVQAVAEDVGVVLQRVLGVRPVAASVTEVPGLTRVTGLVRMTGDACKGSRLTRSAEQEVAATERLSEAGQRLRWTSWGEYPKVVRDGREYAQIGERLYTRHAVERMLPRGLGAPSGAIGAGRSVSPTFVEDVIATGTRTDVVGPLGEARLAITSGDIRVILEDDVVVTVTRVRVR